MTLLRSNLAAHGRVDEMLCREICPVSCTIYLAHFLQVQLLWLMAAKDRRLRLSTYMHA